MELVRRLARNVLGYNSLLYSGASRLADITSVVAKEGLGTWKDLRRIESGYDLGSDEKTRPLKLRALRYPIHLRPGTRDVETVISTVIRGEYARHVPRTEPLWMVDAGAYIGDTAAFFLSRYPSLRVIAAEPSDENADLAERNLSAYGDRALLLRKGLWGVEGRLRFGGASTGGSIQEEGSEIDTVSIPSLIRDYSITRIDILKIDIEGGEESVFTSAPEQWLDKVGVIIIEIHGARLEKMIAGILCKNGFAMLQYRSVWYCAPV
jgi:FkbM family methyltransferase